MSTRSDIRLRTLLRRLRRSAARARSGSQKQPEAELGPCVGCRKKDSWSEVLRIANVLVTESAALGITLHRLPSEAGNRFGISRADESPDLSVLLQRLEEQDVTVRKTTRGVKPNVYEFDQHTAHAPTQAVYFLLHPRPHCERGAAYLKKRQVWLELTQFDGLVAVVPRPAFGPRVYDAEHYAELEVNASSPEPALRMRSRFPIDIVYTWVDSSDQEWQRQRAQIGAGTEEAVSSTLTAAVNASRWHSRDELRYSMRSVWMYAPFVRRIYVVTNGQVPEWLTHDNPAVQVITHSELYDDQTDLPTFNSNHIETVLHRIPGLSEHFLYLNDDVFFGTPASPSDFFTEFGLCKVFKSSRHLDERPVTPYDRATVVAHKNSRAVIHDRLGEKVAQKFQHTPHAMRRSVWDEVDDVFGDVLRATRHNKFRSRDDVNGQFLFAQYALIRNHAVPAKISYAYHEVPDLTRGIMRNLHEQSPKVFCINDSNSEHEDLVEDEEHLYQFFEERFPVAGPWEK